MKLLELKKLDANGKRQHIIETRKSMMALRFQKVAGELTDTSQLSKQRKMIARIKTLQRQAVSE
jgi:large subunit ribosomal protein L29